MAQTHTSTIFGGRATAGWKEGGGASKKNEASAAATIGRETLRGWDARRRGTRQRRVQ